MVAVQAVRGSITGLGLDGPYQLGSSLSDHFGRLPARTLLGERASLEQGRRTATVRAVTDCRIVSYLAADLPVTDLRELAAGHYREDQQW